LEYGILGPFYDRQAVPVPRYIDNTWEHVFRDTSVGRQHFGTLTKWSSERNQVQLCTAQDVVDRVCSQSVVSMTSVLEKQHAAQQVKELLRTHPDTKHLPDGEYPLQYRTDVAQVGINLTSFDNGRSKQA
jgi:hypothetical protein